MAEPKSAQKAHFIVAAKQAGFDVAAACRVADYNKRVPADFRLDVSLENRWLWLFGNTRQLWPLFVDWYVKQKRLPSNPLDYWVERQVQQLLYLQPIENNGLYFCHSNNPKLLSFQHICEATSLALRGPMGLCVHPLWGPWFALRWALVVNTPLPMTNRAFHPCDECERKPCLVGLDSSSLSGLKAARLRCPVGKAYRYSDEQITYHYHRQMVFRQE